MWTRCTSIVLVDSDICWYTAASVGLSCAQFPPFFGVNPPSAVLSAHSIYPCSWKIAAFITERAVSKSTDQPINHTINVSLSWFMQLMKLIRWPQNALITWFTALSVAQLPWKTCVSGMNLTKAQRNSTMFQELLTSTSCRVTVTFRSSDLRPSGFGLEDSLMRI